MTVEPEFSDGFLIRMNSNGSGTIEWSVGDILLIQFISVKTVQYIIHDHK